MTIGPGPRRMAVRIPPSTKPILFGSSSMPARVRSRCFFAGALLIFVVILTAFIPAIRNGYIWDDDSYVTQNRTLVDPGGLYRIWFQPGATAQYYPLVFSTFYFEHLF